MSSENQNSVASNVISYVAFPALFSAGHIKNAVKYNKNGDLKYLKNLDNALKATKEVDTFQRNSILLKQYEELAAAQKIPLKDRFLNIFRKKANKVKPDSAKIDAVKNGMKNTEEILKTAGKAGFKNNFKEFFSKGLKDKFGLGITVACAIPDFLQKVLPKFKEGNIKEGLEQTGKWTIKTGADFLSFVAGNALGSVVGSVLIPIPGIGAAIGRTFVSMLGISAMNNMSSGLIDKVLGPDEENKEQEIAQEQEQVQQKKFNMEM